jgi:hypothetical protein
MLVIGAVSAVAALEAWQQWREGAPALAQPVTRVFAPVSQTNESAMPFAGRLARQRLSGEVVGEPFGAREAPRATVAAPPPVAPVAAPFPYRYAGQLDLDDGKKRVYLIKGNDLVLINVGDVLDGVFKVTAISEDSLEVLHVPTAIATQMQFSAMVADAPGTGTASQASVQASYTPQATSGAPSGPGQGAAGLRPGETPAPFVGSGIGGAPVIPTAPGPASAASAGAGVAAVTTGSVPTGRLGSPGPTAGATPLGVAPSGSGSMPMLPAPVGVMRTLPPPTGRLGI